MPSRKGGFHGKACRRVCLHDAWSRAVVRHWPGFLTRADVKSAERLIAIGSFDVIVSGRRGVAVHDQEEWKRAVARILQRYGARLVGELLPLELNGVFKAKISFDLSPDGKVSNIKLVESSGNSQVDATALKFPTTKASFPAFTPDMSRDSPKKIVAPFEVRLEKPTPSTAETTAPAKAN